MGKKLAYPILLSWLGVGGLYVWLRQRYDSLSACIACSALLSFPFFAYAIRRWDVYASTILLYACLFWWSERRYVYLILLPAFVFWSPRTTDNILLVSSYSLVVQLMRKHISYRERFIAAICCVIALVWLLAYGGIGFGVTYYKTELIRNTAQVSYVSQLGAYGLYMWERGIGPWGNWLFAWMGVYVMLRRGWSRVFIAGAVSFVVLSLIPKKNHYYIFICWPFLPLFLAHGLNHFRPSLKWILGVYYLCMVGVSYGVQSQPEHFLAGWLGGRPWKYAMRTEHFQTYDDNLNIRPSRVPWAQRTLKELKIPRGCFDVVMLGSHDEVELQIRQGVGCVHFRATLNHTDQTGIILVEQSPQYRQYWSAVRGLAGLTSELVIEGKKYWYLRRSDAWFSQQKESH